MLDFFMPRLRPFITRIFSLCPSYNMLAGTHVRIKMRICWVCSHSKENITEELGFTVTVRFDVEDGNEAHRIILSLVE